MDDYGYAADADYSDAGRLLARTENKGTAEIREWEINENSTRYDYLLAAPSDEQLTRYWYSWAGISLFGGLFVAAILIGFLSSKNVRSRSFNVYLIYLMIPDSAYSTLCGIVCLLHALNGSQIASLCNFQMMFIVWGVGSNMWLNAAVTHQLYAMLKSSNDVHKYKVPTIKYVTVQALAVYVTMIFLGTWGLIEAQQWPHYVASTSGLACLPMEQDWKSSIFFWLVFFPLFGGVPVAYITYVSFIIWKKKLLPPKGKRRLLALYFGRIVFVFVLCWVPYMILLFVFTTWMPTWVHFLGGTLSHLQGTASAILSLQKPDLLIAVKRFYCCERGEGGKSNLTEPTESNSRGWLLNFNARSTFRKSFGASSIFRRTSILGSQGIRSSIFKSVSRQRSSAASYFSKRNSAEPTSPFNEEPSPENPAAEEPFPEEPSPEDLAAEPAEEESEEPAYVSEVWPDEDGEYNPPSTASTVDLSTLRNQNGADNSDDEAGAEEGGNRRDRKEASGKSVAFKDFDLEKS